MKLALIYARSENRCIGQEGRLPWHLPSEFKHFKETTMGCPIIMGRRTYEDHSNLLPGRTNIVLTSQPDLGPNTPKELVIANSLEKALAPYQDTDQQVFIIGGAKLFEIGYQTADTVFETVVHGDFQGDTFLPEFDFAQWQTTVLKKHPQDEKHSHAYTAVRYDRHS